MAVEGATQALIAAFFFGIVLNAASAALVLYLRGYGLAAVFRDSQRLVLVLFLLSAALWAQIDFIAILLDITTSPTPCQISLIFSSIFDQFARFSIEQFLLWALNTDNGGKLSVTQLIPQVLVLARFLAGAVFIGFTRPQTDTFCVATTSAMPVGITVTALDGAIVLLLIIRAYSARGVAKDNREGKGVDSDRARALLSVLLGLAFWTGTSVPLLLGIESLALATRTALPAGGLLVVIVFVASGAGTLLTSRATDSRQPEAPSPRRINISRDISTSDTDYPPSRFEDLKEAALRSSTTFVNPREAPRVKDETSVKYYPFGMETAFHNEPMPPLPASIIPASELARRLDRSASHKKHVFDFGKGKITIGHPVLQDNVGQNPLSKIAVMDLKEAAMADRERRAKMHEDERVAVGRSAGPLMGMAPEEVLKRGVSLKRKEVASVSIRESVFPGALHHEDVAVGSSTSAQLSPGGEETRRRSPRQSLQEELVQPRQASPVQARSASPQNLPLTTQKPLLIPNIRPSRMLPAEPKAPPPEPTKTPLQRRPTIGLPSNPRARGVQVAEEHGSQHRTILFVNNIEYDDPLAVEAIIKTAGYTATKQAPTAETPRTSRSVVNRPRPIPRKVSDESAQSSPALAHRRSKSGGSLIGRKSLLAPSPGSPTRLPPLPTLPRSATVAARPQPNDTKSMTFDEKVTLLFPTPPSANAAKRRSPVPNVPLIPASYLDADSSPSEPLDRNHSNRTTRTSVRTESVLQVDEISWKQGNAVVNTADAASSSWLRAFGDNKKRRSSPVIPAAVVRASAWTETTYDRSEDDATNWSQVNSPELAVSVPVAQRLGLPLSIRMPAHQDMRGSQLFFADNRSRETLPIMLDTSTVQQADFQEPPVPEVEVGATPELPTWHRRVGDRCPTFSNRKEKTKSKSRKMAPPAPLSLNTIASTKILAIQVEPSPLESPEQAIRQIQAQLKKLEELDHASPQSATRRIALLEDLEREMGQQADHWLEIKHDMGRDSLSSMQTTSPSRQSSRRESVASTVHVARESLRQSIGAERRASRNSRLRVGGNPPKVPDATVRNSVSPHLSNWQKRLTEAQMDYVDARLLRRTSNVNLLQLSRAQLASPTPPDSDDSSEAEASPFPSSPEEIQVEQFLEEAHPNSLSLWTQAPKDSASPTGFLWAPVLKPVPGIETRLPGLSVRPAQRKEWAPLLIESAQLWRKPYNTANRPTSGLWRPLWASAAPPAQPLVRVPSKTTAPSQKPPRPVTQRPPRRSKRVTLLPDIIENPEPLPDKRGTLGIFQFPWGEKSNTASMQPRPSVYMAMPGTMTTGGPSLGAAADSRSTQFEQTEYSSSFFDDYDDEVEMDSDEEGSDDGFDDSTLWEIASLLKTDSVPSRDSLLPTPSESVVGDYIDELTSDEEGLSSREQSIVIGLAEPRELFFEQQRDSATLENATLSMLEDALESETPPKPAVRIGLPANPRAALQVSRAVASEAAPAPEMSRMARDTAEVQGAENAQKQGSTGLWYPPNRADETSSRRGLFVPGSSRSDYRRTSEEPAAKYMSRTLRPAEHKPLERLTSTRLWGQTASLWYPPSPADEPSPRGGLFVPGSTNRPAYRGTLEEPAAKYTVRKARSAEQKPLERLASTRLWGSKNAVNDTAGLWCPPSQDHKPSPRGGLFVPGSTNRPAYRGTSEEPAAKHTIRKARSAEQKPLERLTSTRLWGSKNVVNATEALWCPPSQEDQPSPRGGLFVPGSTNRPAYRGTSQEPAAMYMSRKRRVAEQKPLDQLTSTYLWTSEDVAKQTTGLWNPPSQADKPSRRGGLFVPGSNRSGYRGTSEEPAAKYMSRKPRPTERKPLDGLASTDLWASADVAKQTARNWIKHQESRKTPARHYQRPQVSREDWKSALKEAIAASYPHTGKVKRVTASPAEWNAALQEAISLSARHPAFDSPTRHPVFAASSLVTRSEWPHPAAAGYTNDVSAAVHPIFSEEGEQQEEEVPAFPVQQQETSPWQQGVNNSHNSAIQAQIEALEQERLFVERAAKEEYLRRTTALPPTVMMVVEVEEEAMLAGGGDTTVQDLQRRLSQRIRQSLVFSPSPAPPLPLAVTMIKPELLAAVSRSGSTKKSKTSAQIELSGGALLWTAQTSSSSSSSSTGMWSAASVRLSSAGLSRAAEEDAEVAVQRARRRRVMQKLQRRQEILAQIAAVEAGMNPFVDFAGMGMWVGSSKGGVVVEEGRDWLHSVCVVKKVTRGVVLRY